jgi:hypothetical protein
MSTDTIPAPTVWSEWRRVFRRGFAPALGLRRLKVLADGLRANDPRLIQGMTCNPSGTGQPESGLPPEGACAVGYACWQAFGLLTTGEIENEFARRCLECDSLLGELVGCRWFLNWFDETPRELAIAELLPEVEAAIVELEASDGAR